MLSFTDYLSEAATQKKPSLKALSDAATEASKKYRNKPSAKTAREAGDAHKTAYYAHKAKQEADGDKLSNTLYNRMSEHGKFSDHYDQLHKSHLEKETK